MQNSKWCFQQAQVLRKEYMEGAGGGRWGRWPKIVLVGVYEGRGYFLSLKCGYNLCIFGQSYFHRLLLIFDAVTICVSMVAVTVCYCTCIACMPTLHAFQ